MIIVGKTFKVIIIFFFTFLNLFNLLAQDTILSGRLTIVVEQLSNGAKVLSIDDNGTETLNTTTLSEFFTLSLNDSITIPSPEFYFNQPEIDNNLQVKKVYLKTNSRLLLNDNTTIEVAD